MILFSPNVIVISDIVLPIVLLIGATSPLALNSFWVGFTPIEIDVGVEGQLVENVLRTIFKGSTRRAIQESSGEKTIERGLKS